VAVSTYTTHEEQNIKILNIIDYRDGQPTLQIINNITIRPFYKNIKTKIKIKSSI